ncbi:MAG: Asp-tRNA(Asn)/Glu-tRNA(Gln) amidotransferase subunit GatC [Patescibacteria group bacterium]
MSTLKSEEISHLATLARVSLSDEESKQFAKQLPQILEFVDQLKNAKITGESPSQAVEQSQLRDDVVGSDSLSTEQLEKLAPKWQNGQVVVPAVFGESEDV